MKIIHQKAYSAPYIIFTDCYEEPLGGEPDEEDEDEQLPSKAYSTTVLQSAELQEQLMEQIRMQQQQEQEDEDGSGEATAQLLYQQQQKL